MPDKSIKIEAVGEFPFTFYIEKAEASEVEKDLILEGIASTTNIDHDNERMSKEALRAMEAAINKDGVPLRVEHQKDNDAIIGRVFKAWVDDRNQLHIQARLDKSHPVSSILHSSMKQGAKMGLSVGGIVKRAMKEFAESAGGLVKTFYDVALQEVSVTPRPANYDSWLVAKSIARDVDEAERFSENLGLRREFLLENSQLDYLQAFAKSIPDKAWRKVESPEINKDINNMPIKKEEETHTETDTEKAVSRAEFDGLAKTMKVLAKGFETLVTMFGKAMDGEAHDQENPDQEKPKPVQDTAKAETTDETDTTKAADETETETTKAEEVGAHDQNNPAKEKPEDESPTAKADSTDTYDLDTVERATKSIEALSKRLFGQKKTRKAETTETDETTKAEETTEDETTKAGEETTETETTKTGEETTETETTKSHPLDIFVAKTTLLLEAMVDRMEKGGKRIIGIEKSFAEDIQNNPEMQKEIQKMMKIPGQKKSVAMGVPFMVTKDGRRFPLVAVADKVEKSDDKQPKDFKGVYKSRYSSVSEEATE